MKHPPDGRGGCWCPSSEAGGTSKPGWRTGPLCVPPPGLKHTWEGLGFYANFCSHQPVPSPTRGRPSATGWAPHRARHAGGGTAAPRLGPRHSGPGTGPGGTSPGTSRPGRGRALLPLLPPRARCRAAPAAPPPPPRYLGSPAARAPRAPGGPEDALQPRQRRSEAPAGSRPEPPAELRSRSEPMQRAQRAQTSTFWLKI